MAIPPGDVQSVGPGDFRRHNLPSRVTHIRSNGALVLSRGDIDFPWHFNDSAGDEWLLLGPKSVSCSGNVRVVCYNQPRGAIFGCPVWQTVKVLVSRSKALLAKSKVRKSHPMYDRLLQRINTGARAHSPSTQAKPSAHPPCSTTVHCRIQQHYHCRGNGFACSLRQD